MKRDRHTLSGSGAGTEDSDLEKFTYFSLKKAHFSCSYEGWNFNSGNYLFTTDTK